MDIAQLEAFISVAELQSFSKAATQLYLTQSAVSKRIAALESYLDVALFERFGQRIRLTEAGKTLLIDAREILDKVHDMQRHSDMSKNRIAGKLRVVTSHHIGLYRLPQRLRNFVNKYPEVQLDMHFTDSEIAHEDVAQGLSDVAIATLPQHPASNIETTTLWQDELVIMFANNHAMCGEKALTPAVLGKYPAILPDEDTFTRHIIDSVFADSGIQYPQAFTTNYLETIKVMVEAGLGWSVLPKIMLNQNLTHRTLANKKAMRTLGLMLHKHKVITPALRAFLDEMSTLPTTDLS